MSVDAAVRAQERVCDAGEFVVECFTTDGETYPHVGSQAVRDRVVRCRDCLYLAEDVTTVGIDGSEIATGSQCDWLGLWVKPDGFCAWGVRKED